MACLNFGTKNHGEVGRLQVQYGQSSDASSNASWLGCTRTLIRGLRYEYKKAAFALQTNSCQVRSTYTHNVGSKHAAVSMLQPVFLNTTRLPQAGFIVDWHVGDDANITMGPRLMDFRGAHLS